MAEAVETMENAQSPVARKEKSNILLIVLIMMLFIILIGGAGAAYYLLNSDNEVLEEASKIKQNQEIMQKQIAAPEKTTTVRKTDYTKIGPMYPMDQFIVNLFSENGGRYLKTAINLELSSEELSAEIDTKKPLIRDIVIKALSAKTYEEISTIRGKENLKDEVVTKINQVLTDGQVNNIFFTDFVIQ